jgi:uncharacterized membrane protein
VSTGVLERESQELPLSPRAQAMVDRIASVAVWFASRWIACAVGFMATALALPVIAPLLRATGHPAIAEPIYWTYQLACHQQPDRSFFVLGEPLAICQRDVALYAGALITTAVFAAVRRRAVIQPINWTTILLLSMPMVLDGITQLAGLRESSWPLRVGTGALFAVGVARLLLPHLDRGFSRIVEDFRMDAR